MTRLSSEFSIFYVEEPQTVESDFPEMRVAHDAGVTILTPLLPVSREIPGGFNQVANAEIRRLLTCPSFGHSCPDDVVWHYTPMSCGAAPNAFAPALTVYDAMDELSAFRGAPAELSDRERDLLSQADLVFAGGPSLFEQRKHRHPRVSCFPSGVDAAHFAPDLLRPAPADSAGWPSPVLGFYGVLDERIDFDLIAAVADRRPEWTIVLIGPIAKISRDDLPRRPNLIYPGMRNYQDLPGYLDCFDVAILPFALNDATRFISPTKTLEYLAAGKPVVSTPIRDVIDLYGDAVEIAASPEEFVTKVDALLLEPGERRSCAGRRLVANHDWDRIALQMTALIDERRLAGAALEPALFLAR